MLTLKVMFDVNAWWGGRKRQPLVGLVVDHLQLFGGFEPEIAEVWALYWQETIMAAATVAINR